ncbi:MAG: HD domain-containing protein [Clostridia bacterium]|nr:HD domain-containing protein [Clostridia bacterium]
MKDLNYGCQLIRNIWEKEAKLNNRLLGKQNHSERVAKYLVLLSGKKEYEFYGLVHDIGRIEQIKKINNFDDKEYNHAIAGIDYIEKNNIEYLKDFEKAKDAIQYHSNYLKIPKEKECDMIKCLTLADQLDNAISCKNYLENEEQIDNKGYKKDKTDGPFLTQYFLDAINKENFLIDKRYCKTYLDYFYFAYTLLIRVIHNDIFREIDIDKEIKIDLLESFDFFEKLFKERVTNQNLIEKILMDMNNYKKYFMDRE